MNTTQLDQLRAASGFWYLGTPYSKYPSGITVAFEEACRAAAWLVERGVSVYCPIAHTHPIAIHGKIDPLDHEIWLPIDRPLMNAAVGLIVCQMETWAESYGLKVERYAFEQMEKPIVFLEWPQ